MLVLNGLLIYQLSLGRCHGLWYQITLHVKQTSQFIIGNVLFSDHVRKYSDMLKAKETIRKYEINFAHIFNVD